MSGAAVTTDIDASEARAALARLNDSQIRGILAAIGAVIKSQTVHRIDSEKRAPDGGCWAPWSLDYARSRSGGHSLLENEGHLRDSIGWQLRGDEVAVGTNLVYGAVHQFGGDGTPARPYLGFSGENRDEIERLVVAGMEDVL